MLSTTLSDSIYQLLFQEGQIYQDIEALLSEYKTALIHANLPRLYELNTVLQIRVKSISDLEKRRVEIVSRSCAESFSIETLLARIESPLMREKFIRLRRELQVTLQRVQALKQSNEILLGRSEQWVEDAIGFWISLVTPERNTYSGEEHGQASHENFLFQQGISTVIREA